MRFHKDMLHLYAITEERGNRKRPLIEMVKVKEVLEGGVTILQLREKHLSDEELMTEALEIKELCHSYGVPLIINDNVDLALRCGADGVHVGIEDTPVAEIRAKAGKDFIIGATAKTVEQATAAELAGADYIGDFLPLPSKTPCAFQMLSFMKSHRLCRFLPSQSAALRLKTYRKLIAPPSRESRWFRRFSAQRILRRQLKS